MDPIIIGSSIPAERMHNIIEKIPRRKDIQIKYEKNKDIYIYSFFPAKSSPEEDLILYKTLARFTKDLIFKFYIDKLVEKQVKKYLVTINPKEREAIQNQVNGIINDKNRLISDKDKIRDGIFDYLIENNTLIVDGYIRFRPFIFEQLIDKSIEIAMDNIHLEMEYDEFINMLKYFVDTNPSEIDLINLIINKDGYKLLDENNLKIDNDDIAETLSDLFQDEVNEADLLLSTLIAMSPKKIIVHIEAEKEEDLVNILDKIFKGRIKICHGCSLCNLKKYNE